MARIRSIHPGLTSDEAYMSMSMTAKAGWAPLWMQCDDHGIFEWKPIVLKALIFPADAVDFSALLAEWIELGCIRKIEIEGRPCGVVRSFARYQRPKNPSYRHFTPANLPPDIGSFIGVKGAPPPVLPQSSPITTEVSLQMEEEGGSRRREEESGEEKKERDPPAPVSRDSRREAPGTPITLDFQLTDADRAAARDCGMDDLTINAELSKFIARNMRDGAKYPDWSAAWSLWCLRWKERKGAAGPPPSSGDIARATSEKDWDAAVARFAKNASHWSRHLGGEPGTATCRCPPEILKRHGIDPATGMKSKENSAA